jgi:membrane protease YdiL (CAAX protease family)
VILLQLMIFAIPAVVYAKLRGDRFVSRIRLTLPRTDQLWFAFCMLIVMITGALLCEILTGGIASLTGNFKLYNTFVARLNGGGWSTLYVVLAYGILPAFCEELIFRAFLCAEYERYGVAISVTVSALFFSMLHLSFALFPAYLLVGALLGCAMYTTRSFYTAFLLHALYNLFCLFGQPYLSAFYVHAGSNDIFIFCVVTLFLLFSAFAAGEARKQYHLYARANADASYTAYLPVRELPLQLWRALRSPACAVVAVIWLTVAIVHIVN